MRSGCGSPRRRGLVLGTTVQAVGRPPSSVTICGPCRRRCKDQEGLCLAGGVAPAWLVDLLVVVQVRRDLMIARGIDDVVDRVGQDISGPREVFLAGVASFGCGSFHGAPAHDAHDAPGRGRHGAKIDGLGAEHLVGYVAAITRQTDAPRGSDPPSDPGTR